VLAIVIYSIPVCFVLICGKLTLFLFIIVECRLSFFSNATNGLRVLEVGDFGAQNFQATTKVDARQNVQLTTEASISLTPLLADRHSID
jgi:hypothetical protein